MAETYAAFKFKIAVTDIKKNIIVYFIFLFDIYMCNVLLAGVR